VLDQRDQVRAAAQAPQNLWRDPYRDVSGLESHLHGTGQVISDPVQVDGVALPGAKAATMRSVSYRAWLNRRSTARWTRRTGGTSSVVRREGAEVTAAELIDYTHDRLAAYKRPREVVFLSSLPATSTGKIMRRKLADARSAQT
jgi:acyl-CoA synthetase (AMP-forming)/AMP-acid ligase II